MKSIQYFQQHRIVSNSLHQISSFSSFSPLLSSAPLHPLPSLHLNISLLFHSPHFSSILLSSLQFSSSIICSSASIL
ncbi:hypothetical protein PFISCL1PPCAC_29185, partial [Pristionchus fissidentatus]